MIQDLALNEVARQFAELLLQRRPDWTRYLQSYKPSSVSDPVPSGSLKAEIPSPSAAGPCLSLTVSPGEALVALGVRGAEKLFIWDDPVDRGDALGSVLNFIADITTAEVVLAWERHRFLWKTWETAQFRRAADASHDRRIVRIEGWPEPV